MKIMMNMKLMKMINNDYEINENDENYEEINENEEELINKIKDDKINKNINEFNYEIINNE
jgi:hypothetical protein